MTQKRRDERTAALKSHEAAAGKSWYRNTFLLIMRGQTITHYVWNKTQGFANSFLMQADINTEICFVFL